MKKVIIKHFYKICIILLILFLILSISFNSRLLNIIFFGLIGFIISLLYFIRKEEIHKINQKFAIQQHLIEKEEDRYMSEKELSLLYSKIYDKHFNC